jgi:hypothetical protein
MNGSGNAKFSKELERAQDAFRVLTPPLFWKSLCSIIPSFHHSIILLAAFLHIGIFSVPANASTISSDASSCFPLARLKYGGGGDWYTGPTMLPNLGERLRSDLGMDVCPGERVVEPLSADLYDTPVLFMTGHGRVAFTAEERRALRTFLARGGLLFADDNYGLAESFRVEMRALFPDHPLQQLPVSHSMFHSHHAFPRGLPKIHEHDGLPPAAYGIEQDGRIVVLLTHETGLGNGWGDASVHNVPPELREQALRMGVNVYAWFLQGARAR